MALHEAGYSQLPEMFEASGICCGKALQRYCLVRVSFGPQRQCKSVVEDGGFEMLWKTVNITDATGQMCMKNALNGSQDGVQGPPVENPRPVKGRL
jgi:hypothetical protein